MGALKPGFINLLGTLLFLYNARLTETQCEEDRPQITGSIRLKRRQTKGSDDHTYDA